MAATDLGKVGIVMKGTWSSSATYEVLDAVSYNSGFYIAKQAVPAGTLPTNTTYWQLALGNVKTQQTNLYNTVFGASSTAITLNDSISNYEYIGIDTANQNNTSGSRGYVLAPVSAMGQGRYFSDWKNSWIRVNASGTSFTFLEAVDSSGNSVARYIHNILGFKVIAT